jgi:CTP:molybdopterin cytidylyltransferase MocA
MFGSMQRRWEMRRLIARLETARRRKSMAIEAFVSGKATTPVITASSTWSHRVGERPDASQVADAIAECERLEAEVEARLGADAVREGVAA